jgi:hypothetical protein
MNNSNKKSTNGRQASSFYALEAKKKEMEILNMQPEPDNFMYRSSTQSVNLESKELADCVDDNSSLELTDARVESMFGILFEKCVLKMQKLLNPQQNYVHSYVVLDSENCIEVVNNDSFVTANYLSWYYSYSNNYLKGAVSSTGDIGNIVGIRIASVYITSKRIPSVTVFNSTLTFAFEEFSAQSYITCDGRKFHFNLIQSPLNYDNLIVDVDYYWFSKPIVKLDTLTISLGNPTRLLELSVGRTLVSDLRTQMSSVGALTQFTLAYLAFQGYVNGDIIKILGFTTSDPIADAAVIANMNDPAGHVCTVTSGTTIRIPVDISTIAAYPVSPLYTCIIYNGRLRTIVNLEIIYAKDA